MKIRVPSGARGPFGAGAKERVDRREEKPPSLREVARRAGGRGGSATDFLTAATRFSNGPCSTKWSIAPYRGHGFFMSPPTRGRRSLALPLPSRYDPLPLSGRAVWDSEITIGTSEFTHSPIFHFQFSIFNSLQIPYVVPYAFPKGDSGEIAEQFACFADVGGGFDNITRLRRLANDHRFAPERFFDHFDHA